MGDISPQGYQYGIAPKSENPFWGSDAPSSDIDITASATVDQTTGEAAVTVEKTEEDSTVNFDFSFSGIKGEKGEKGDTGAQGETGPQGATGPDYNAVISSSITNEDGIYTLKNAMHDGTEVEVGTIEAGSSDNGIVEVKDTVTENSASGYDYHTLTETQNDGTENAVGSFYIAQKQIASWNDTLQYFPSVAEVTTVDQSGAMHTANAGFLVRLDRHTSLPLQTYTGTVPDTFSGMILDLEGSRVLDRGSDLCFIPFTRAQYDACVGSHTITTVGGRSITWTDADVTSYAARVEIPFLSLLGPVFSSRDTPLPGVLTLYITSDSIGGDLILPFYSGVTSHTIDWGFV